MLQLPVASNNYPLRARVRGAHASTDIIINFGAMYLRCIRSTAAAMKTMISASSWSKVSALLYYVAIVVSTFIVPLADVEYISWSVINY